MLPHAMQSGPAVLEAPSPHAESNEDVQAALRHGRVQRANPGLDGSRRLKVTHRGTHYIIDEKSHTEITSWRMDDAISEPAWLQARFVDTHTIVVVDESGSMRKSDVPGYKSRTEAVYHCLVKDLLEPQLQISQSTGPGKAVVSLIEMGEHANIVLERNEVNNEVQEHLREKMKNYKSGKKHGNYIRALDAILELLHRSPLETVGEKIFVVFLSDGAPSDHVQGLCEHRRNPYSSHHDSRFGNWAGRECRKLLQQKVRKDCVERVLKMGDLPGRNRLHISTIAFGPADQDYKILEEMSKQLPNGHFSKLGLNAGSLRTAFSSLTSSLTSFRASAGSSRGLTERRIDKEIAGQDEERDWWVYVWSPNHPWAGADGNAVVLHKQRFDRISEEFVDVPIEIGSHGVARSRKKFAQGAERVCFRCYEFQKVVDAESMERVGLELVGKESKHVEHLLQADFHKTFCRVQEKARHLAGAFNRRINGPPAWRVEYLIPVVYTMREKTYPDGIARILCEAALQGTFLKW
jgi:hypothetical protein